MVGAVVIGRNEGVRLLRCLMSVIELSGHLVYVDSASTDGSADAARELGANVVMLDMSLPFTAARARSEGFARLVSLAPMLEHVMFIDGDCVVENGWLETASTFLDSHPDFAVVCGRRRELSPASSRYNALADREWATPIGEAETCGGDAMMRCQALRDVGGFNPSLMAGEEPELCHRLRAAGWRIMRLDAPMTIHDAAMTRLGQWWMRAVRSGFGYAQAWHLTRGDGSQGPLYSRELARTIIWAALLPLGSALLALLVHPLLVLLWPLAVATQYLRLVQRDGRDVAAFAIIGKYAELTGALRYFLRALNGSAGPTISYK
jgi:GT2 family glycosyltransferase